MEHATCIPEVKRFCFFSPTYHLLRKECVVRLFLYRHLECCILSSKKLTLFLLLLYKAVSFLQPKCLANTRLEDINVATENNLQSLETNWPNRVMTGKNFPDIHCEIMLVCIAISAMKSVSQTYRLDVHI